MPLANVSFVADREKSQSITEVTSSGLLVVKGYSCVGDLSQAGDSIQHRFKVGGYRWCFDFYPRGDREENYDCICFCIYLARGYTANDPSKVHVKCSFVDRDEQLQNIMMMIDCYAYDCHDTGYSFCVKREFLESFIKEDRFTVRCDFSILTEPNFVVPQSDILQDLRSLFLSGEGTDVTFQVGGETFTAHRCVLAAQSAVFKSQLFGNVKKDGTANTVIHIEDMEAPVFKLLLGSMYSEAVPEIEEEEEVDVLYMWNDLLVAADRYEFLRLRRICEQKLCTYIGVSTVAIILSLAEQHCRWLKEECLEFLCNPAR